MYKALIKHSRYSLAIDICWCLQVHHMALMQHGIHQTKALLRLLRVNNAHFISSQTTTMIIIHSYTMHISWAQKQLPQLPIQRPGSCHYMHGPRWSIDQWHLGRYLGRLDLRDLRKRSLPRMHPMWSLILCESMCNTTVDGFSKFGKPVTYSVYR